MPDDFRYKLWKGRYEALVSKSFSQRFSDIAYDMNTKYSRAVIDKDIEFNEKTLEETFKEYLSKVYDKDHDNRFCGLKLRDNDKNRPALVLSVDADVVIRNALEIEFALRVFLEEWYPDLNYGDIYTEWV